MTTIAADWAESAIGHRFDDTGLLERALTHRSVTGRNNERLEFLGDAVLDAVISDMLLAARPGASEGELSRLRSSLVRDRTLAELATELGVGPLLNLGSGERRAGGVRRQSILADATEALLGAVFLDGGYRAVDAVVRRLYARRFETLPLDEELKDAKTRLQEWLQARSLPLPAYAVVAVVGKPHEQTFTVNCCIDDPAVSVEGHGSSRRKAEQAAAAAALAELTAP